MIKFNKSTHLMILFTFAIIFVVLYLYYTINDVKRMSNELKKITSDVQKINLDIQGLNGALNNLNLATNNLIVQKQSHQNTTASVQVVAKPVNNSQSCQIKQSSTALINDLEDDDEDDDATSVNTEELKNIINENDGEEEEEKSSESEKKESIIPTDGVSDADESDDNDDLKLEETVDFHKLKYEELKDLCKKKGISTKGTKDQLISKLQAS